MTLRSVPNVPPPPGAEHVYDWDWDNAKTPVHRAFDLESWDIDGEGIAVDLSGTQHFDGSVDLHVIVHLAGALTPDDARRLGAALLLAADGADRWNAESAAK